MEDSIDYGNEDEIWAELAKMDRQLRWRGLWESIKHNDECEIYGIRKWFYVFKLFVCLALGRSCGKVKGKSYRNYTMAIWDCRQLYAGWECQCIDVGDSVFRNWWYEQYQDGEWTM